MYIAPVSITSLYNVFLNVLEGQVHKDSKLGIMTNLSKSRLVKVIFSNIHKISDACAEDFFILNSSLSGKMVFLRKLKLIYLSTPKHYNNYSTHTFLILFKNVLPHAHLKKKAETMHSI